MLLVLRHGQVEVITNGSRPDHHPGESVHRRGAAPRAGSMVTARDRTGVQSVPITESSCSSCAAVPPI
jgi:hypothetical protein